MHNSSHIIQDENGAIIPHILRDMNGGIIVDDNSAFYIARVAADKIKLDNNKILALDNSVAFLKTEVMDMKTMLLSILQKLG